MKSTKQKPRAKQAKAVPADIANLPEFLSCSAAAKLLGLSHTHVRNLVGAGKIGAMVFPSVDSQSGRTAVRISRRDFLVYWRQVYQPAK